MSQPTDESKPPSDEPSSKAAAVTKILIDVFLTAAALVGTWVERSLAIQERIATALEAKPNANGGADIDVLFHIVMDAYEDPSLQHHRSSQSVASIVREKYGARIKAALGHKGG